MFDIFQITFILVILVVFGSIAFFLSEKLGMPRVALILIFGFVCGITGILSPNWFDPTVVGNDFPLEQIVKIILIVVLFFGGYSIDIKDLKGVLRPGTLLATVGAFIVAFFIALIVGIAFPFLFGGITALIIGSLLAPNDPIAVISTQDTFKLNPKAETISKFESGLDDTMVTTLIILILIPIGLSLEGGEAVFLGNLILSGIASFFWLTGSAVAIGIGMGYGFSQLYKRIDHKELRTLVNVILPWLTFTVASLPILYGGMSLSSGYVAVFIAGFVFGRSVLKDEEEYRRIHKIWEYGFHFCEIFCFMILGALVRLDFFLIVLIPAIVITLSIILITRPIELAICTFKTDLKLKDKLFIGYIGLKGLDPAVLAIAAYQALGTITNPHVLISGVGLLIPLTFTVILFVTVGQSTILAVLFSKKGYYARKEEKRKRKEKKKEEKDEKGKSESV